MPKQSFELAHELKSQGKPFVLATVIRREAPISARPGDKAVITADGGFSGWVGGSCAKPTVVGEALKALRDGRPRLIVLTPRPEEEKRSGIELFSMTCHSGGTVEIYIAPYLPPPRLLIMGPHPLPRPCPAWAACWAIGSPSWIQPRLRRDSRTQLRSSMTFIRSRLTR